MARKVRPITTGRMLALVKATERKSNNGATGQTILKQRPSPVDRLVHDNRIGQVELTAAQDITIAYLALTGALWLRAVAMERVGPSPGSEYTPARVLDALGRYRAFTSHWSRLAKRGDKTLAVLIDAAVHELPLYAIEDKLEIRNGTAREALIRGLRDYCARAGWVDAHTAMQWKAEASTVFATRHPGLSLAITAGKRKGGEYQPHDDFAKSIDAAYEAIRERQANGGKGWEPKG